MEVARDDLVLRLDRACPHHHGLRVGRLDALALECTEHRLRAALTDGQSPGVLSSLIKVFATELSQHIDELLAYLAPLRLIEPPLHLIRVDRDEPVHVLHDVERRIVDRDVVAQRDRLRRWKPRRRQGRQDPELAPHVVSSRLHVRERRRRSSRYVIFDRPCPTMLPVSESTGTTCSRNHGNTRSRSRPGGEVTSYFLLLTSCFQARFVTGTLMRHYNGDQTNQEARFYYAR